MTNKWARHLKKCRAHQNTMTLLELNRLLETSLSPEQVFKKDIEASYREYLKICHPDANKGAEKLSSEVYLLLHDWKTKADFKKLASTYGDNKPYQPPYVSSKLKVHDLELSLVSLLGKGIVSTVHEVMIDGKASYNHALKVSSIPSNNDLLENEERALVTLHKPPTSSNEERFFKIQQSYIPHLVKSFYITDAAKAKRRAHLLATPLGKTCLLSDIPKHFPNGLPVRHAYWIYRRALLTLYYVHNRGLLHGGLTPDNILLYPDQHGLVLLDWVGSVSTDLKKTIPIINSHYKDFYPSEVLEKKTPTRSTDLYILTKSILSVTEKNIPKEVQRAFDSCLDIGKYRPQDALEFHTSFGEVITKVHGPRKYEKLEI